MSLHEKRLEKGIFVLRDSCDGFPWKKSAAVQPRVIPQRSVKPDRGEVGCVLRRPEPAVRPIREPRIPERVRRHTVYGPLVRKRTLRERLQGTDQVSKRLFAIQLPLHPTGGLDASLV